MKDTIREYLTAKGPSFINSRFWELVNMELRDIREANANAGGHYWEPGKATFHGTREVGAPEIGPGGVYIVQRVDPGTLHVDGTPWPTSPHWRLIEFNPATGRVNHVSIRHKYDSARAARKAAREMAGKWSAAELAPLGIYGNWKG